MNSFKTILVLAVCLGVAMSSPCSDQCTGACDLAKTQCDMVVVLGPVCGMAYGSCMQGCSNICDCVDGCNASCAPAKETCEASATTILERAQCVLENDVCVVDCQALCGLQKVGETVTGLIQAGLGVVGGGAK